MFVMFVSVHHTHALLGCRPFLALVSMDPLNRLHMAALLGWALPTEPCWGDPHQEAD